MELKEVVSWLAQNDYIVMHKSRYLLTSKFNKEMTGEDIGVQVIEKPVVKQAVEKPKPVDWIQLYQKIIMEAKIPSNSDNGRGGTYRINAATKPGREAFKKAIEGGATYETLLKALQSYYSVQKSFLVKVEKFFTDEIWRNELSNGERTVGPKFL